MKYEKSTTFPFFLRNVMDFLVHKLGVGRGVPHLQGQGIVRTEGHRRGPRMLSLSNASAYLKQPRLSTARGERANNKNDPTVRQPLQPGCRWPAGQEVHLPRHTARFLFSFLKKTVFVIRTTSQEIILMTLHLNKTQPLLVFYLYLNTGFHTAVIIVVSTRRSPNVSS